MGQCSKRPQVCYRCGKPEPTTRDHVFPAALFVNPRPNNLITVPACRACNADLQKDEQYFRFFILLGRNYYNPAARRLWNEGMRPYIRRSPRFAATLVKDIRRVEVRTPKGLYLGQVDTHPADEARIDRVIEKIVRGLYYHRTREPLGDVQFTIRLFDRVAAPEDVRNLVLAFPLEAVGQTVSYRFGYAKDDPRHTVTATRFYESGIFVALTNPLEGQAVEPTP